MKEKIIEVSKGLLVNCLDLKEQESFLVIADDEKKEIGECLYLAGKELGAEAMLMIMGERNHSGEEPPLAVAAAMLQADAVICATKHSLTHTQARKAAAAAGSRIATMPGITEDMFLEGAISADYSKIKTITEKITKLLTDKSTVTIVKAGCSLTFDIKGRSGIPSTGMYVNKGESGNLPSGEAYIAPVEGSAHGKITVDGSIAGIGLLTSPLILTIHEGRLVEAEGDQGQELLEMLGTGEGRLLGEFGIGTNKKARVTGVVLEDEKVYGTIHIAFGSNMTFGGTVFAGVHIDCVVMQPQVFLDDLLLMENGELLAE